jgi:dephospho-CoA kinase
MSDLQGKHRLIVVCGNAGVGKTTYSIERARSSGFLLLDIDTVSEQLVQAGLRALDHDTNDRDSPRYKQISREAIHETLFSIAEQNLAHASCLVVAPFTRERRDPTFKSRLDQRFSHDVEVVYVWCDDTTRKERVSSRDNPRDAAKLRAWKDYAAKVRDPGRPPFEHVFIDTSAG